MENETSTLFSPEICKWMAIAAFHNDVASASLKAGAGILTREQFVDAGIACYITPQSIIELTQRGFAVVMITANVEQPPSVNNGRVRR